MNFRPCVTGRSLEYKLNRIGASLEEGRYVWVSKNWCHCPCAPWNVDLETADPPVGWTNMACFYSVCREDQCARQWLGCYSKLHSTKCDWMSTAQHPTWHIIGHFRDDFPGNSNLNQTCDNQVKILQKKTQNTHKKTNSNTNKLAL